MPCDDPEINPVFSERRTPKGDSRTPPNGVRRCKKNRPINKKKSLYYAGFGSRTPENPRICSSLTYLSLKIEKRSKNLNLRWPIQPFWIISNFMIQRDTMHRNSKLSIRSLPGLDMGKSIFKSGGWGVQGGNPRWGVSPQTDKIEILGGNFEKSEHDW